MSTELRTRSNITTAFGFEEGEAPPARAGVDEAVAKLEGASGALAAPAAPGKRR